ncbi:Cryptic sugar kinase Mak [hydrothermal vent metagenome]|uniref:Cryptic sugar kinase Mak n=1 Tax=hydrothermal vent metagenome TaxID=652676 RepID=A0A3B1AWB6_9ZZZZ
MRIGIDLGGTKIEVIALDDGGAELYRQRLATPQHDYAATLNALCELVNNAQTHTGQQGSIGIGIPGAISPATSRVKNANSTWLIGQPLKKDLEKKLNCAVKIENDANCFVVSEATDGAAKNANTVFGVIIGTGTGGGICINKQVLTGCNAIAGEWGHNSLPWQDATDTEQVQAQQKCYCGKADCIETFLSGPGFEKHYQRLTNSKQRLAAKEIIKKAEHGEQHAVTCIELYEKRLAKALAHVINIIDPDVIVLGGGMSNIQRLYKNVPQHWGEYVFSDTVATQLLPPLHGDSSGVRGAAWLWPPN